VANQTRFKKNDVVMFRNRPAIVRLVLDRLYVVSRINEGGSMEATHDELSLFGKSNDEEHDRLRTIWLRGTK
jgi:hypothetical protein